jgi:hypothetical protein
VKLELRSGQPVHGGDDPVDSLVGAERSDAHQDRRFPRQVEPYARLLLGRCDGRDEERAVGDHALVALAPGRIALGEALALPSAVEHEPPRPAPEEAAHRFLGGEAQSSAPADVFRKPPVLLVHDPRAP